MKIWQKENTNPNDMSQRTEKFTVGNDKELDLRLAYFDTEASLAHAEMLQKTGLITSEDLIHIKEGLSFIQHQIQKGDFIIEQGIEDIHSQIEKVLTEQFKGVGKKIHTGRSRNDQVLVALKMYFKHEIKSIAILTQQLFETLIRLSETHKNKLLPGYTHFQLAMPSSFGLWFGAYAESLTDDMEALIYAYNVANKNPLGSGAGYGSTFPLDRDYTTQKLGFSKMNVNSMYAQMTRGKTEKALLNAMSSFASTIAKFSYDVCLFLSQQFAYLQFPESLTTGSSIMPHKKNPDVFELLRAKCNRILASPNEITLLQNNLPSGYHRDMQLCKDIVFPVIDSLKECLDMLNFALQHIQVKDGILNDEKFNDLFTVESINEMLKQGSTFRDAYIHIGQQVNSGDFKPNKNINHTHIGSIGNLGNDRITRVMQDLQKQILDN
jgi:argininosuccinate lyase